jgi:membrane protein
VTQLEREPETPPLPDTEAAPASPGRGVMDRVRRFIEHTDPTAHPLHKGLRAVRYVRRLSDAYATHQCSLMACACAYCAVLSLVPLLIVGVALLGFVFAATNFGDREKALVEAIHVIQSYVPVKFDFLRDQMKTVLETRRVVGIFGLTFLIYGAHQTFLAMQPAMNIIWVVPETRHWFRQRLVALGATFFTLILLPADLAATTLTVRVADYSGYWINSAVQATLLKGVTGLLPVFVTTILFAVLYQMLPDRHVPWKSAFIGAGVAAFFWQITKFGFGYYILHSKGYAILYGSLSSIVILVVWMYYSMALLLLGAEVAADYEFMRHGRKAAEERSHSGADLTSAAHDASAPRPALPTNTVGMEEVDREKANGENTRNSGPPSDV